MPQSHSPVAGETGRRSPHKGPRQEGAARRPVRLDQLARGAGCLDVGSTFAL